MAYRSAVDHIEKMDPVQTDIAAEDLKRVVRLIDSVLPTLITLPGSLQWRAEARVLYEHRLGEAIDLVETLRDGYDKAGKALEDYATAQQTAKRHVAEGIAAEGSLGRLIADIVRTQSLVVQMSSPLAQWNDLRASTGVTDWLIELEQGNKIDAIRDEANSLWNQATGAYDAAIRVEREARDAVADRLRAAYRMLPDFLAHSADAARIIATTPGLRDEVEQAAADPNARRPGAGILRAYQVADDPDSRRYPDGWRRDLADRFGGGVKPKKVRKSEARILDELYPWQLKRFEEISNDAFRVANERFPSDDQNDDHNDAFRHTYWNALLTREFGSDWARRFATAHEAGPGNMAAREAMDLYNNEQGRAIAVANPDATPEKLADLIQDAVGQGRTVVIDRDGELAFSDQVRPEDTGDPKEETLPGHPQPTAES